MTTNRESPSVSIVIPTRNRPGALRVAIASVLAQRGVTVEVIVVDEASSDSTPALLQSLADQDPRIQFVRHDHPRLLPGARNAGVERATSRWVAFLDDDDAWHPNKLRLQLQAMEAANARWCCCSAVLVDDQLEPFGLNRARDVSRGLQRYNAVPAGGSGVVVERSALLEAGGFNEELVAAEDWECWLRLLAVGAPAVVDIPVTAYRVSATSMSHDGSRMDLAHAQVAALHPEIAPNLEIGASAANHQRYLALQLARAGERRESIRRLLELRPVPPRNLIYSAWVFVTGTAWQRPVRFQPRATRVELRAAKQWIGLIAIAAATLDPPIPVDHDA